MKFFLVVSHVVVTVLILSLSSAVSFSESSGDVAGASPADRSSVPAHSLPTVLDGGTTQVFLDYRLDVPSSTRRIEGIELQFDAFVTGASLPTELFFELSWDGGLSWTTADHRTPTLRTAELNYMIGSATDDWGHRWTVAELNNPGLFRVRVGTTEADGDVAAVFSDVGVRVAYHPGPDGPFHQPARSVERIR